MPRLSSACETCKERRVKCDEGRPTCERCRKARRICLGYHSNHRRRVQPEFRDENRYATGIPRKSRHHPLIPNLPTPYHDATHGHVLPLGHKPRADEGEDATVPISGASTLDRDISAQSNHFSLQRHRRIPPFVPHVPVSLGASLEEQSINLFASKYISAGRPDLGITPWLQLVSHGTLQRDGQKQTMLITAFNAVALAVFHQHYPSSPALMVSRPLYGHTITMVNDALQTPHLVVSDELLVTIMLLIQYEGTIGGDLADPIFENGYRHHDGVIALLHLRRQQRRHLGYDSSIVRAIRGQMLRGAVMRSKILPAWLADGAYYGEKGLELELDACYVELVKLRVAFVGWQASQSHLESSLQPLAGIIEAAGSIDSRLRTWQASLPPEWSFEVHEIPDWLPWATGRSYSDVAYSRTIHTYSDLNKCTHHNRARAARMIALNVLQKTASAARTVFPQGSPLVPDATRALEELRLLVDDVCASVPYHFALVGTASPQPVPPYRPRPEQETDARQPSAVSAPVAFLAMMPLLIAQRVEGVPLRQKRWIQAQLLRIAAITGSGELELIVRRFQHCQT